MRHRIYYIICANDNVQLLRWYLLWYLKTESWNLSRTHVLAICMKFFCDKKRSFSFSPFAKRSGRSGSLHRFPNSKALNLHSSRISLLSTFFLIPVQTYVRVISSIHWCLQLEAAWEKQSRRRPFTPPPFIATYTRDTLHLHLSIYAAVQPSG